jgi:hypothetical protein
MIGNRFQPVRFRLAGPAVLSAVLLSAAWGAAAADLPPGETPATQATAPSIPGQEPDGRPETLAISVDIRPGLCPNHIRLESSLAVPIAILSRVDFDIDGIEPGSVRLYREGLETGVKPAGWAYEDVGTPIVGGTCACHKLRGDGLDDIEFYFWIEDIVKTLGLEDCAGETVPLTLRGALITGEPVEGVDCAVVISGEWGERAMGREIGMLVSSDEGPAGGNFEFSYYTTVSDRVTFAVYDAQGRIVAMLNNMDMAPGIYSATWNGRGRDQEPASPGMYFVRLSNSRTSQTRKITLLR